MYIENLLFLLFGALSILFSLFVVISKNPVHSILSLILVFFNAASLLIILGAEFLAMLFVIVYVGAVAVLFLFVIMMLNVKLSNLNASMYRYLPISTIFGFVFLCEILVVLYVDISSVNIHNLMLLTPPYFIHLNFLNIWANSITPLNNIVIFGQLLYTYYSYLFITSGLILLVSMIGAISLTLHRRNDIKRQYIYKQVQRDFYTAISWKN